MSAPETVTQLLQAWRRGDRSAEDRLIPLVYDELRQLARNAMRGERAGHTLQPTALVHEAYLRLIGAEIDWQDRVHFLATAATVMRRILVDHARAKRRQKRGGSALRVSFDEALLPSDEREEPGEDLLELDAALVRLEREDARKSRVVELHYFGGLTYDQTAVALGVSAATVDRDLRFAKAWLSRELR